MSFELKSTLQGRFIPHIHGTEMLKLPNETYTTEEIFNKMPRLKAVGEVTKFIEVFSQTRPYKSMFENDTVDWYSNEKANEIALNFRNEIENWLTIDLRGNPKTLSGETILKNNPKYQDQLLQYPINVEM